MPYFAICIPRYIQYLGIICVQVLSYLNLQQTNSSPKLCLIEFKPRNPNLKFAQKDLVKQISLISVLSNFFQCHVKLNDFAQYLCIFVVLCIMKNSGVMQYFYTSSSTGWLVRAKFQAKELPQASQQGFQRHNQKISLNA